MSIRCEASLGRRRGRSSRGRGGRRDGAQSGQSRSDTLWAHRHALGKEVRTYYPRRRQLHRPDSTRRHRLRHPLLTQGFNGDDIRAACSKFSASVSNSRWRPAPRTSLPLTFTVSRAGSCIWYVPRSMISTCSGVGVGHVGVFWGCRPRPMLRSHPEDSLCHNCSPRLLLHS